MLSLAALSATQHVRCSGRRRDLDRTRPDRDRQQRGHDDEQFPRVSAQSHQPEASQRQRPTNYVSSAQYSSYGFFTPIWHSTVRYGAIDPLSPQIQHCGAMQCHTTPYRAMQCSCSIKYLSVPNNSHPHHCVCVISQSLVRRCFIYLISISSVTVRVMIKVRVRVSCRVRLRFHNSHMSCRSHTVSYLA